MYPVLEPYKPPTANSEQEEYDFDILNIINDLDDDQQLVLAATQMESNYQHSVTKSVIAKKSSPKKATMPTFAGCTFGSIGTLNIHIHKH